MKKLIFSIVFIVLSFALFSQEVEWEQDYELEDFFYSWDVEVEAWTGYWDDGFVTVNLEDVYSEDWFDVRRQLSTTLFAIYDEASWQDLTVDDLEFDLIIYSWFEYDDPFDSTMRYDNEDLRWDIYIDKEWIARYFSARRDRDRTIMVSKLVDSFVAQWEEENRKVFKRDLGQFKDLILQQEELEQQWNVPNLSPLPQKGN